MSGYAPTSWADGPGGNTPIQAARLNNMESGILSGQPLNNRVAIIGDSIAQSGPPGSPIFQIDTWFTNLVHASKGRIEFAGGYGTGGYTLAQIQSTWLPAVLALSPRPAACVIQGATNDAIASPNDGSTFSLAASSATWLQIVATLRAAGIRPIAVTIPPSYTVTGAGDHPTIRRNEIVWNSWLKRHCARHGIPVVDLYEAVSQTDGTYGAGLSADNVHPNSAGIAVIVARAVADGILNLFPPGTGDKTSKSTADLTTLFNNGTINEGLFTTDANSDGVPDGLLSSGGTGFTVSLVSPVTADALHGKWCQLAKTTGASGSTYVATGFLGTLGTNYVVGDTLSFAARVQTENCVATSCPYTVALFCLNAADTGQSEQGIVTGVADIVDGLLYIEFTVPPGTTAIYWSAALGANAGGATAKLRIGEVTIRNLTALGIL